VNIRQPEDPVPTDEPCQPLDSTGGPGPLPGHGPPPRPNAPIAPITPMSGGALLWPGQEGRLIDSLGQVARLRQRSGQGSSVAILTRAAIEFVKAQQSFTGRQFALAVADLAVSGRAAFADFCSVKPDNQGIVAAVNAVGDPAVAALPGSIAPSVAAVLDRAYKVAWFLRGQAARGDLGWIAVSGEDDLPHRPVNVPGTKFPQYDLAFDVPGALGPIPVTTRFTIATSSPPADPPVLTVPPRTCPSQLQPALPTDPIILYIHGSDSRLEEASDLIPHLTSRGFSVISVDLPGSGYASPLEHTRVGEWMPLTPYPPQIIQQILQARSRVVLLPFLEQFLFKFVETLSLQLGRPGLVEGRIAAAIGGSLGGNLGLRLAQPSAPWPRNVVAYSPGSVWDAANNSLIALGIAEPWLVDLVHRVAQPETLASRSDFIQTVFDKAIPFQTQPEQWYGTSFKCRESYINNARSDRQEMYTAESRRWHWRISFEEMVWTWRDPVLEWGIGQGLNAGTKRLMLGAGAEDDNVPIRIYANTLDLAKEIAQAQFVAPGAGSGPHPGGPPIRPNAPVTHASPLDGDTFFLLRTGHSIHAERPEALAAKVAAFVPVPPLPQVATPIINLNGTQGTTTVMVDMMTTTPGATIYYTKNGTNPTTSSLVYSGDFQLTPPVGGSITVIAIAAAPGYISSANATAVLKG
jgi:pimeloyl-ACP methyl ester carboxylesterase